MKRSGGLTVLAVLLMLAGAVMGVGSLLSFSRGLHALDVMESRVTQQLDRLPTGTGPRQITPAQFEQLRQGFQEILRESRKILTSSTVRTTTLLSALLGIAAVIAGIGLVLLRGWARTLALWQACGSIPLGLFTVWWSPQQQLSQVVLRSYQRLADPATLESLRRSVQNSQVAGQWVGTVALLAWNGLILWCLTRASVKAQCQQHDTVTFRTGQSANRA